MYTHGYARGKWVAPSYCNDYFETRDLFHFHLMGRKLFPSASPIKSSPESCTKSVLWRNVTTESTIYTTNAADIKLNTIMWKSPIYHTLNNTKGSSSYTEITLEEEPAYTCDYAILTSFPQIFFSPLIRQEFGTENEQGEDYEYEDSENKDDNEEEGSDSLSTPNTPTELPQDILRKSIKFCSPKRQEHIISRLSQ
jgi:hypothetical protein